MVGVTGGEPDSSTTRSSRPSSGYRGMVSCRMCAIPSCSIPSIVLEHSVDRLSLVTCYSQQCNMRQPVTFTYSALSVTVAPRALYQFVAPMPENPCARVIRDRNPGECFPSTQYWLSLHSQAQLSSYLSLLF